MNNDGKAIDLKLAASNSEDSQSDPLDTEGSTKRGRRRTPAGGSRSPQNSEEISRPADLLVLKKLMEKRDPNAKEVYDTLMTYFRLVEEEDPSFKTEAVTYSGFMKLLRGRQSINFNMFGRLLNIMDYQMIIAPLEASVKISVDGNEAEIPANEKEAAIKLYKRDKETVTTLDENARIQVTETIGLTREYIKLPRRVSMRIRAPREKRAKAQSGEENEDWEA